jgi:hypothetical protein
MLRVLEIACEHVGLWRKIQGSAHAWGMIVACMLIIFVSCMIVASKLLDK